MRFWGSSKLDEIGWCWMHIQAWIWWQGILLQSQFSLFLCILKPEAYAQKLDRSKTPAQLHIMKWNPDLTCMIPHFLWHWNFGTEWHWCWCGDIHRSFLSDYIDFTKTGNVEQELPLQNGFLYISGFSGETGRPRFFHIIPLQNGPLYFWRFSFFQVAILLKCLLMPDSPLCRGQCFWKS